jgi:hypothetical protein
VRGSAHANGQGWALATAGDSRAELIECAPGLLAALQRGDRSAALPGVAALSIASRGQTSTALALAKEATRIAPDDAWATRVLARNSQAQ